MSVSEGTKRWALGYWCGMATMAAIVMWSYDMPHAIAITGLAIALFFCDVLYTSKRS